MHLLLDDQLKAPRPVLGTVVSAVAHVALFLAVILSGGRVVDELADVMQQTVRFLIPPDRVSRPTETRVAYVATTGDGTSSGPSTEARGTGGQKRFARATAASAGEQQRVQPSVAEPTEAEHAYSILEVDSAAVRDPTSAAPSYPAALEEKGVEGSALLRFVVDSTGLVDLSTVQVRRSTHPLFSSAVTSVLPDMRFRPAMAGNKPVRQLVEQEFKFRLNRPPEPPAPPATKKPRA
ncbi:MAG: TonB family protein [Gemmatimonadetes bacterium]|nr:TonB family protein [Gemmatimonadota bacterium]MBI3569160.1 TonB family protein [Gemmatimonadota bacterium]